MATVKKTATNNAVGKKTREVKEKVFAVSSDGAVSRLLRAKTLQSARAAATGNIRVSLANAEDLIEAGRAGVGIENI